MGVNSLPKTVTRQRRGCDLNRGSSAPESSTLTTRLPSHPEGIWRTMSHRAADQKLSKLRLIKIDWFWLNYSKTGCRDKSSVSPTGCAVWVQRHSCTTSLTILPYANAIRRMSPKVSSVNRHKHRLSWQRPLSDRKLISGWLSTAIVLPTVKIWRRSVQ